MTRLILSGPFAAQNLSQGLWQLTTDQPLGVALYLHGVGPEAAEILGGPIGSVSVEWRVDEVRVTVMENGTARHLKTRSAVIHEPRPHLYESLALASFDADAQRFWRRVFGLMRVPGGRFLLGIFARRGRRKRR